MFYLPPQNTFLTTKLRVGDKDAAIDWLNRASNDRPYLLPVYLNTDARLDKLSSDPRFQELRRKMKL